MTTCDCGSPLEDAHEWNRLRFCPPRPVPLQVSSGRTATDQAHRDGLTKACELLADDYNDIADRLDGDARSAMRDAARRAEAMRNAVVNEGADR